MANRNGMGPNNEGPLTGRGQGSCSTSLNTRAKIGAGIGMGIGFAWGCKRRFNNKGFGGNFNMGRRHNGRFFNNPSSMTAYKEYLEKELEMINNQTNNKDQS